MAYCVVCWDVGKKDQLAANVQRLDEIDSGPLRNDRQAFLRILSSVVQVCIVSLAYIPRCKGPQAPKVNHAHHALGTIHRSSYRNGQLPGEGTIPHDLRETLADSSLAVFAESSTAGSCLILVDLRTCFICPKPW